MSNPLVNPVLGLGGPDITMDDSATPGSSFSNISDRTNHQVAVYLIMAGGTLWLLKYWGFRFNFGVAAGRG